jgi:hypothetical protein
MRRPQLAQIRQEQWQSSMDSLKKYVIKHGHAAPTLTTWFPGSTVESLVQSSLPKGQRTFYPGSIRLAVSVDELGEQTELFAVLSETIKKGDTELHYLKRTPGGTTKIR